MKFNIKRTCLIEIFSEFINILKDNPIKPIISGIMIEASDGKIIFKGTNLEINYIRTISCETTENGVIVFKPNLALEYIKLLDEEFIELLTKNDVLCIHLSEFNLLYTDKFPENLRFPTVETIVKVNSNILYKSIEKVKFSVSTSAENIAINCIRILFNKNNTLFISTDSYRLTYLETDITPFIEKIISLPIESANVLCKLIKDIDEDIIIGINDNNLIVEWKDTYFSTQLTTLPFPNFESILSINDFNKEMEFNQSDLKSALKKVLTVAKTSNESKNGAILDFQQNRLLISAASGKAKINQKINLLKNGADFKCSLNIKFLLDFVENLNNNVYIKGNSPSAMFQITEQDNSSYKYILMPLALRD